MPIISAFLVSLAHFVCAYRLRVGVPYRQMLGESLPFLSAVALVWLERTGEGRSRETAAIRPAA